MNEHNIALLRQIINTNKVVCRIFIEQYGEDHELTKETLNSLSRLVCLLAMAEGRCKI